MKRTVVLDVVGLTPSLLGPATPALSSLARACVPIRTVTPAVTCTVQSTFLTGVLPSRHGIVANGWYFRDLSEVWLWRQSNRLVQGPKIWHLGRERDPGFTCANLFWWYNMVTDADWSVTPRPVYTADGRKLPDCASDPAGLRAELSGKLGTFPLFSFWGPGSSIASSDWIARAAMRVEELHRPVLNLIYLPHLDYVLQQRGPSGEVQQEVMAIDAVCGRLLSFFGERGVRIVVLSEYGMSDVRAAVHPNRLLRQAGLLEVKVDLGREYLDAGRSRAFAVADHQVAHVYVRQPADVALVRELLACEPGIAAVLDAEGKRQHGLDHERSGELVLLAEPDRWFSYYFWQDDARAPDYARTVDIHAKPGYDPCELLLDPHLRFPRAKIGWTLLRKKLGFRALLDVIPLDAGLVRGSHGVVGRDPARGPLLMTSEPKLLPGGEIDATRVCGLLLDHVFCE
ncbi:MAG: alkaline phosphatase family protein [Deltaproteobacteria bacterium]|nr:alkaline phosphatase family protein [Deltaproteobacteria bacterium]